MYPSPPVRGAWVEISKEIGPSYTLQSPPVRGAWVEIPGFPRSGTPRPGRPLCGGRGLKCQKGNWGVGYQWSPPVRGAWVEIGTSMQTVDDVMRRPLCGGRGLKSVVK